jgi:DNA ligase-1
LTFPYQISSTMAGTPAKKRKLNDSKASPVAARNLDFFFNKQKQPAVVPLATVPEAKQEPSGATLTDEELARKLQAEWDKEDSRAAGTNELHTGTSAEQKKPLYPQDVAEDVSENTTSNGEQTPKLEDEEVDVKQKQNPFESKKKNTLTLQSAGSAEETISSNIPFDESPLTFDPSKYVAELQGHWAAEGGDASYALLTRCFVLINSTQSRIKIVDTLVNLLRVLIEGDPSSLLPTVRRDLPR